MVQSKRKKSPGNKKAEVNCLTNSKGQRKRFHPETTSDESNDQIFNEVENFAILILDSKGNVKSWNKGVEKIMGYTAEEIIGKNYRIFYTSEDKKNNLSEKLLSEAKKTGSTSREGWRVKKDGSRFWGSTTLTALHDKSGDLKGHLKITTDLTEKKISEDRHSNFVEELKIKNEALKKSEEKYHKMVSEVQDYAIILLDHEGTIVDWNKGAGKLKGYSPKEIIGKNFRLFYSNEDKENKLPERLLNEAEKNGRVVDEGWRIRKDGKRFWASVTITALHDDSGGLIGFTKVTRDLTERKVAEDKLGNLVEELQQANERLKESEERYHKMIEEVQDYAIIMLDTDGNIVNWNNGAKVIKGYSAKEIVGKNFRIFYPKEDQVSGVPDQLLEEAIRAGKVSHEGWRVRKDGSKFWGSVVITALHNAKRELIGFSKVTRDLTERKQADDTLKSNAAQLDLKNKSLERLNDELASFTNVASHDLKEPLRKIQTFATRIKEVGFGPDKSAEFLNKLIESSSRMTKLIDDLLSYSQVSKDSEKHYDINLNNVITTIQADLEVLIAEKNASIHMKKLPIVRGVPHQFHQVFLNLISNAIKFSKPGIAPTIDIDSEVINGPDIPGEPMNGKNQYFHITVRDNGIGFEPEESSRIFDPFFRLHPKNVYAGTGLGLAIVKKVIEHHNGIIMTESQPGSGSVFHLYIPTTRNQ